MIYNCGIIGYGVMGQIRHDTCNLIEELHVKKIFDPDLSFIAENDLSAGSADEIINDPDIDIIFIATPNYLNKDLTINALKKNKHVFCEKPPALKSKDILDIKKVNHKSTLMYGFNHRHHESVLKCKELVQSGEYGKILWLRGRYGKSVDSSFFDNWRANYSKAGGGILMDQGIHMLDLFLYFCDDFDIVKSIVSNTYWKSEVEDNVFAVFKNSEKNISASLHSTMTQWRHLFSLEIFLESGYLVINGLNTSSGTYGTEELSIAKKRTKAPAATWKDEKKILYNDNFWLTEMLYFLKNIKLRTSPEICNSDDAYKILNLIERIYKDGT